MLKKNNNEQLWIEENGLGNYNYNFWLLLLSEQLMNLGLNIFARTVGDDSSANFTHLPLIELILFRHDKNEEN